VRLPYRDSLQQRSLPSCACSDVLMIDAEEIAKLPPGSPKRFWLLFKSLWPLVLAAGLIYIAACALIVLIDDAHAAIHTDRPAQEKAPVASKDQPCTKYVVAPIVYVGKDGKLHTTIIVAPACGST
jgi:hypothetical protein